mgnify:CR=1 FL=1
MQNYVKQLVKLKLLQKSSQQIYNNFLYNITDFKHHSPQNITSKISKSLLF